MNILNKFNIKRVSSMRFFQSRKMFKYSLILLINGFTLFMLPISCTNTEEAASGTGGFASCRFRLTSRTEKDTGLTNVNCYLFKKGIFYKRYTGITLSADGSTTFDIPANIELYFLANIAEPTRLAEMNEGITTRDEFLSYHTPVAEAHSSTRAPSAFYSAKISPDISNPSFNIVMESSLSRIDLDASEAAGIKINRIYTRTCAETTSFFASETLSHSTGNCAYSFTFETPETGKAEDIFRIYESDTPVTFIMEGTYGDAPVTISTPVKQIKRNKIYKIRIQSDGMNVISNILIENWKTGNEIIASEGEEAGIKIDTEHSVLTSNISLNSSKTTADIITRDEEVKMKLAFSTDNPLRLESMEGLPKSISSPEVNISDGKYLTSYEIIFTPNTSELVSCVTLNFKSTSKEGQDVFGKITLNVCPFPYKIRDVFIGAMTWMSFNCTSSQSIYEQVFPETYGYGEAKDLYENNWLESRGDMIQWTENPCPPGYRLPTHTELQFLLCGDEGKGVIPGKWICYGDEITSRMLVAAGGTVSSGGKNAVPRYLEVKSKFGPVLYFPLAGMKETAGYTTDAPDLGNSLCLWASDSFGANTAYAYKLTFSDGPHIVPDYEFKLDKEAYAYARCMKTDWIPN